MKEKGGKKGEGRRKVGKEEYREHRKGQGRLEEGMGKVG